MFFVAFCNPDLSKFNCNDKECARIFEILFNEMIFEKEFLFHDSNICNNEDVLNYYFKTLFNVRLIHVR